MKKNTRLVVVESPTKTKSISKYLGDEYIVMSSKGHIIDLPKSKLGVDVEHNFTPEYKTLHGKGTVISELKKAAKNVQEVYLATDLDREGEAISWHIASALGALDENGKIKKSAKDRFKRVVFPEITKDAVLEAFEKPHELDYNLIDAYQARRVLDRLVGYKLSPLLWKKIQYGLSAGRVQSVALRMIVEREEERNKFKSKPFFKIQLTTTKDDQQLSSDLTRINNENIEKKTTIKLFAGEYTYSETTIDTADKKDKILNSLREIGKVIVRETKSRTSSKKPSPPFSTSTLQRAASSRLSISPKRTMRLAQQLYEEGFITYHRTDSLFLSDKFIKPARKYIKENLGDKYLPDSPVLYKTHSKGAQEAHEAIRPTSIGELDAIRSKIASTLDEKAYKLYELIYKRALSSQMTPAQYRFDSIILETPSNGTYDLYQFSASGSTLVFDGYLKVWGRNGDDTDLPKVQEGESLDITNIEAIQKETAPPPRYNEASLIKALEEYGIGRPSTYAPTIDTIQYRNYVRKDSGALIPTDIGNAVSHLLTDHFKEIVDLNFTADMEKKFDEVAEGQIKWQTIIKDFYGPFEKKLESKEEELERSDYKIIKELDEKCPECGHNLVLKLGRYGKFYSCSNFPECKYAKPFVEKIDMHCPECSTGEIIIRHTRFGKTFYGCSNYPECDWASWTDPRSENYDPEKEKERRERAKQRAAKRAEEKATGKSTTKKTAKRKKATKKRTTKKK